MISGLPRSPIPPTCTGAWAMPPNVPTPDQPHHHQVPTINASAPPRMPSKLKPRSVTPLKRTAASASRGADREKENISHHGILLNSATSAGISKKLKAANGTAVAVHHGLPASTPRKPLERCPETTVVAGPSAINIGMSTKKDKEAKMATFQNEEEEFVTKYTKAFPSFIFHFDSVEPGLFGAKLLDLGGRIDKFFSRHVTHVVTSRPIPVLSDNQLAPPSPATLAMRNANTGAIERTRTKGLANPFLDETGQSDVLAKALTFKMKVWDVKKFQSVITRLVPHGSPAKKPSFAHSRTTSANTNLSHLLEDEKLHGTRERDLTAPRADHHYFTRGSFYVLCEDATAECRTILAREYERPRNGETPEWPVLHGNFLKCPPVPTLPPPPPRVKPEPNPSAMLAKPADRLIANLPSHISVARLKEGGANGDLRRSVSLNNLGKSQNQTQAHGQTNPSFQPEDVRRAGGEGDQSPAYIAASGNSVNITSAITSQQSGTGHGPGGTSAMLAMKGREKRIAELNKRVVPMSAGNVRPATVEVSNDSVPVRMLELSSTAPGLENGTTASKPLLPPGAAPLAESIEEKNLNAKVLADHVYRNVQSKKEPTVTIVAPVKRPIEGRMDPPPAIKKRHSLPGNFERREKERVRLPVREETKKPGYCENCRVKFDDFSTHVVSRKHRRFALDDRHFRELDTVLNRLKRRPLWAGRTTDQIDHERWGHMTAEDAETSEEDEHWEFSESEEEAEADGQEDEPVKESAVEQDELEDDTLDVDLGCDSDEDEEEI